MTIGKAILHLQALYQKHGDIEVFMDCPWCHKSTAPDVIVPVVAMQQISRVLPQAPLAEEEA